MDIKMYLFIKKQLREGISYLAERYSKSNNKYMKNYNPKKPSKFTLIWITCMVGQWVVIFVMVDLSG